MAHAFNRSHPLAQSFSQSPCLRISESHSLPVSRSHSLPTLDAGAAFSETPLMYKIVGADQKEYGPVSEEQIRQWITEGRANAQTIARFGEGPWKPLVTFPEFAALFNTAP